MKRMILVMLIHPVSCMPAAQVQFGVKAGYNHANPPSQSGVSSNSDFNAGIPGFHSAI